MSYPFVQPAFKADLNAEKLIHDGINECNKAFRSGDITAIKFNVLALLNNLMGENVADKKFLTDLLDLENAWEKRFLGKLKKFEASMDGCVAPQLMKRKQPKHEPDFQHWRLLFIRILDLCHQKKMWLKQRNVIDWTNT